jgi:hypothetical protein
VTPRFSGGGGRALELARRLKSRNRHRARALVLEEETEMVTLTLDDLVSIDKVRPDRHRVPTEVHSGDTYQQNPVSSVQ